MKIERMSDSKVKLILTSDDFVGLAVDPSMLFKDPRALNAFILSVLKVISDNTDFNPYNGNIKMEAMPNDEDGISVVLSKGEMPAAISELSGIIGEVGDKKLPGTMKAVIRAVSSDELTNTGTAKKEKKNRPKIRSVKAVKAKNDAKEVHTFMFEDFDALCGALSRMSEEASDISELYKTDEGYALVLPMETGVLDDAAMIMEFACDIRRALAYEHIREHGNCIAKESKLTDMVRGIRNLEKI